MTEEERQKRLDHFTFHDEEMTWLLTEEEKEKFAKRSTARSNYYLGDNNADLQKKYSSCNDYLKSLGLE